MAKIYCLADPEAALALLLKGVSDAVDAAEAKHDRMLTTARREAEYVVTFYATIRAHESRPSIEFTESLTRRWFNAALCGCPACNP